MSTQTWRRFAYSGLCALILVLGLGGAAVDSAAPPDMNTMCPVLTDEAVDPGIFVEYEGKRVYFCCNRCRMQFLENPDAYVGNLPQFAAHAHEEGVGQAEPEGVWRLVRFLGRFHPIAVHFPIALVLATLLAEALSVVTRKPLFAEAARFSIILAAASAAVSAGLGWAAGAFAYYPGDLSQTLWLHRWIGTGASVLILLTAIVSELTRRLTKNARLIVAYRMLLVFASITMGITGHLGAVLIYGFNYFTW